MKLVDSYFEVLTQGPSFDDGLRFVEDVARTCYKSHSKTTEESYKGFTQRMIKSKHLAMIEFFTVYLEITEENAMFKELTRFYEANHYSKVVYYMSQESSKAYITTNYRVIIENNRLDDLKFLCDPTKYHKKRYTVRFYCSRSVAMETLRHRLASFAMESQRYVLYSKEKFGGELTYIIPDKIYRIQKYLAETVDSATGNSRKYLLELKGENLVEELVCIDRGVACWYDNLKRTEDDYLYLTREEEWAAEDARDILPNACHTILNVCMFEDDWNHFFDLRSLGKTGRPDPNMKKLADQVLREFINRKLC